ncbi:MAG: IPExxxVDY family protein [Flavobacteriaceae bacterium]|nr:IPExxxVDY family protein [Flavobacteriaceae bacterium]
MKTFKLDFDDFLDDDFELLAIHTTLESYHLAYFMNLTFDIQFKKSELIQDFDFYEFNDEKNQSLWNLVANKGIQEQADTIEEQSTLFFEAKSNRIYLLPEYKKVDYLVKIEHNTHNTQNLISKMNTIPQIITTFVIDVPTLKSKNNLIFY